MCFVILDLKMHIEFLNSVSMYSNIFIIKYKLITMYKIVIIPIAIETRPITTM